ncbi:MAG: hypothetical protein QOK11_3333, partial [Pseudonocardiales bacterium]|nr:hypothetical protein [Pseudonocardiales bacterium]
ARPVHGAWMSRDALVVDHRPSIATDSGNASCPASLASMSDGSSALAFSACLSPPLVRSARSGPTAAASRARDECSRYQASFRQAQTLRTFNGKPLVVLTATGSIADTAGWSTAQDKMATLSSNVLHTVADTTHAGLLEDRRGAVESVSAIDAAVRSARTRGPLSR